MSLRRITVGLIGLNVAVLSALLANLLPASDANPGDVIRARAFDLVDD